MLKLDSLAFRGVCTSWNIGVLTILHLPTATHTYMLGPLMKQPHMSLQLYKCYALVLYRMKQCRKYIVRVCILRDHHLDFFRNKYGIDICIIIVCDLF